MRTKRLLPILLTSAALVISPALAGPAASARPTEQLLRTGVAAPAASRTITLITGDKVLVSGGNSGQAAIVPGEGRRQVRFEVRRTADRWLVLPSDVRAAIRNGQLDERLFELNGLLRDGYDDASRADIPLLVTGRSARAKLANATTTRALPSINGVAVRVAKKNAKAFLSGTTTRSAGQRIWLDGKLRTSLDHSVPQIGAPAAWQAGYTGRGVKVAVLDSGIDSTHPDLAGQVLASANFTDEPLDDLAGHGTHVASTIAGKGLDGYRGVAPDAKLLNGKVCNAYGGCDESDILAGLDWAVAQHAAVVNLSLGGPAPEGMDPLEEAVNRLTAQTGTLFVVAAGNTGGKATIGTPGTAEAALTVGAVDGNEQLAGFSSQGPGPAGSIKPDITAPGVGIVAARSSASHPEEPVGDKYVRMSGTSMATPHVAGAAALLVQQHSDWKAPELKGALMAAAKPNAGLTAYQQGAGRVDVGRAVTQAVVVEQPSVSFGTALWPHADDKPVTKQLTYRNLGTASITLELQAKLARGEQQAPSGALELSTNKLTIAAGGTATVQVSSNTKHDGPDGLYDGRIVATAGQQQLVTPIAVDKEVESYNLTVDHLGADGQPTGRGSTWLWGLRSEEFVDAAVDAGGREIIRAPRGSYLLQGSVNGPSGEYYQLTQPELTIVGDRHLTVDARTAKPVSVQVPAKDAKPYLIQLGFERTVPGAGWLRGGMLAFDFGKLFLGRLGEPVPDDQLTSFVSSSLAAPGPAGDFLNTPYIFSLIDTVRGQAFDGLTRVVRNGELAHVASQYNGKAGTVVSPIIFGAQAHVALPLGVGYQVTLPAKVDQYYEPGATEWTSRLSGPIALSGLPKHYRAGASIRERWNAPVFAPGFAGEGSAVRAGDAITVQLLSHNDQDGHAGSADGVGATRLLKGDAVVAESDDFGTVSAKGLDAGVSQYRLEAALDATSPGGTRLVASFRSGAGDGPLPITAIRFHPVVDANNLVVRQAVTALPFSYDAQAGTPSVRSVRIEYSADGKTWKRAGVVGSRAIFPTPPAAKTISLRATIVDRSGNTTTSTIGSAYELR